MATTPKVQRYVTLWRNKFLTITAKSLSEMASILAESAKHLAELEATGKVWLDVENGVADDYAWLFTTDPEIAKKYGFDTEEEVFGTEEDDEVFDLSELGRDDFPEDPVIAS